jgi:hypothetical protein
MRKSKFKDIVLKLPTLIISLLFLAVSLDLKAQTVTTPLVPFLQRTSAATPSQTIYNVKGDFTMLGNTNLTLQSPTNMNTTNNEGKAMKYVDVDGNLNTLNSSKATLELTNSGENSSTPSCSRVIFAGLYWTGKSIDADTFTTSKQVESGTAPYNPSDSRVTDGDNITNTNYRLDVTRDNPPPTFNNTSPIYTFTGNGNIYIFNYTNNSGASKVTVTINGGAPMNVPVTINTPALGTTSTATLTTPYPIPDGTGGGTITLSIKQLTRSILTNLTEGLTKSTSSATVNISGTIPVYTTVTKNYDKKVISLKGPKASVYTNITARPESAIRFPGSAQSGIFIGYQEITSYVQAQGPGAYTVADIALTEGTNANPGLSGGWVMIVVYENPLMNTRAVTLFDGYAFVNGQNGAGEYGTIPISGFRSVDSGQVNMKLGVMAAEGDVAATSGSDYLAVQKHNADANVYNSFNYLTLNHAGNSATNFFNSSIFPIPATGKSDPILQNNTGVDFSMFTIPNDGNLVIGNDQTSTTFRFGSTYEVYTIFGLAMSVNIYVTETEGIMEIKSINTISPPAQPYTVLPGQEIEYTLTIKNKGTEAISNTIVTVPISSTINFSLPNSIINFTKFATVLTTNEPYYDPASQSIIWDLETLPLPLDTDTSLASVTFKVKATDDCAIIVNNSCNSVISVSGTITGTGAVSGISTSKAIFKGFDNTTGCPIPLTSPTTIALDNSGSPCFAALAGPDQIVSCGGEIVNLIATTGTIGTWTKVSGPAGGVFSNHTSTSSTFSSPNAGNYLLRWETNCAGIKDDILITFVNCAFLNFDGDDDNVTFKNNYSLNSGSFSLETWIKSNETNGNKQTIISKRLGTSTTDGYDLKLVDNIISFNWNNGHSITSLYPINTNRWYHVVVTFNGENYKLYIDGVAVQSAVAGVNPILNNSANCILGAMDQSSGVPFNYFNGWMDELRVWKVELTVDQIRQMMNQEIINNDGNVKGAVVPLNIPGLTWSNLDGYYQMNPANDVVSGSLLGKSTTLINGKLRNIGQQQPDTAPLPYTSIVSGQDWSQGNTWTNYTVWEAPNSLAIDGKTRIDWNIVKTDYNITSTGNKTVLGLLVNSNSLNIINASKIEVTHYLKLDGKIDLVGMSQLIQTEGSILDENSTGSIERDQQGQSNKYNYNYWSSPVSPINTNDNNIDYTVAGVMKDGTDPASPLPINWVNGYDGSADSPISLARYWLCKFDNYANDYANWLQIGETDLLHVGQGYTLKGSGALSGTQNYTFVGKPNNGTIATNTVAPNSLLLTGNPYPSALDANAFINDNESSIDGNLYFWEHYSTNNTHILREYQGGYAVRNLTGGTPPSAIGLDYISGLGSSSKGKGTPNQFIPVGQGFFVNGKNGSLNQTITYKNSQRRFVKETENNSNLMFKIKDKKDKYWNNNESDKIDNNNYTKIRLGFDSNNTVHRQVLLGFMNEKATNEIDYGYDALNVDELPNDMYFTNGKNKLVIEGVGFFDKDKSYPIGVKTDIEGEVKFMIDSLENFDKNQNIFIHDSTDNSYHNIRNEKFEVKIPIGENNNRFSLRFTDKTLNIVDEHVKGDNIIINYFSKRNSIEIANNSPESIITKATLYNMSAQLIAAWNVEEQSQRNIKLPIKKLSSGIYIARIYTSDGELSKKIIIP